MNEEFKPDDLVEVKDYGAGPQVLENTGKLGPKAREAFQNWKQLTHNRSPKNWRILAANEAQIFKDIAGFYPSDVLKASKNKQKAIKRN